MTISGLRGGSGKSVTALNLSVSLSLYEKKVLLVDCDPQGCVSEWSGVTSLEYPFDLTSVLGGKANVFESISKTEFAGLDILPAGLNLFPLSLKLSRRPDNEKLLRLLMNDVRGDYDYIILDAPSSFGYLSVAALAAADWLVAAMAPRQGWISDFHDLLKTVQHIRQSHDIEMKMGGILFNRCNGKNEIFNGVSTGTFADAKPLIFDTTIPEDETVDLSLAKKTPLALYDIKTPAAQAYLDAARDVISEFKINEVAD